MSRFLAVEKLDVSLDGQVIIKDLSFELNQGENLAVIGPNGSGKTSLLKTLLGFFPYKGVIKWAPNVRMGYVPQKIEADRHLPVNLANLLSAKASVIGVKKHEIDSVVEITKLNRKILETPIGHLSGGQFQRALIAFALLGNPNVLLLDEPTASIDQLGEEQIYELINHLQEKYGITIIIVSHDLSVVYGYATKVLCLNKTGVCFGPPGSALTQEVLKNLYGDRYKYVHHLHKKNVS